MEAIYNVDDSQFRFEVLATVIAAQAENKTPKKFLASLSSKDRRQFPELFEKVLERSNPKLQKAHFDWMVQMMPPTMLRERVSKWYEAGCFNNGFLSNLDNAEKIPLQYLTKEQLVGLQKNRLRTAQASGVELSIFTPEQLNSIKDFVCRVIREVAAKRNEDVEYYRRKGCPEERLIENHAGHVTKDLASSMDKLENSIHVDGISIAEDEKRSFDWVIFGILTEKKMFSILPKHDEDSDPTFSGNSHSDKTKKHLLISLKCDKHGVPIAWWACVMDIVKGENGCGDFRHKPGDTKSSFSNFKLTYEALTRPSVQIIAGDYRIIKKFEGCKKTSKHEDFCTYPALVYESL